MKRTAIVISSLMLLILSSPLSAREIELKQGEYSWMSEIRNEHPRLFLTAKDIPIIRMTAKSEEAGTYDAMKTRVDELMLNGIEFTDVLAKTGEGKPNAKLGLRVAEAAMVWMVTENKMYLDFTKELLRKLTDYYQLRVDNNLNIEWYCFSQICALCAYDWIYNELSEQERETYGKALYEAMNGIAWHGQGVRKAYFRENVSFEDSGMYGTPALPWYIGLTFHGEGFDDEACKSMIKSGYDLNVRMTENRSRMVGEKGGGTCAVAQYAFGYHPVADFNFIYSFKAATGIDISENMSYVLGYLTYMDWVRLPGNKEYGFGDIHHYTCLLPQLDMNSHIYEIVNIYGSKHPEIIPVASRLLSQFTKRRPYDGMPFMRLLHKVHPGAYDPTDGEESENKAHSIYFDTMGQAYMRSGTTDDDTYVLFATGGISKNHKHFDNNNFIIYKNGYRALDSGTRPEPGWHLPYYFVRTVAHNCVTIRKPDEVMPKAAWGGPAACEEKDLPIPNDGGQCQVLGSKLLEMTETEDYVYLASDATEAYSGDKAKQVVREFVYIMPDLFVVYDRLESTNPDYTKRWLIHTVSEPVISEDRMSFSESSEGGKMICATIFPKDAKLEKVGGPGKNFWNDGRNWDLPVLTPEDYGYASRHIVPPGDHPQVGQWRVEVYPGKPATKDHFMHIIQVGDKKLKKLPAYSSFEYEDKVGVSFSYNGKKYRISFYKDVLYGCSID